MSTNQQTLPVSTSNDNEQYEHIAESNTQKVALILAYYAVRML